MNAPMHSPPIAARKRKASAIFRIPALLLLATLAGLVLGLAGDGVPDMVAWLLLAIPLLVALRAFSRRRR